MTRSDLHGGDVHAASRELGVPLRKILDFSASINPLGPSPRALHALKRAIQYVNHYPDPDCTTLRAALSRRYRLPAELFVIGNGSAELIHLIPGFFRRSPATGDAAVLVVGPTFSEYARAMRHHGISVVELYADRKRDYAPSIPDVIRELKRESLGAVILCNPNSPTGRAVPAAAIRELLHAAASRQVWVIVDETFAEYAARYSVIRQVIQFPRLIVLRSFTKFYALPGLRIGYAVASREVARELSLSQAPWSVNTLAQAAAFAALGDTQFAKRSLRFMTRERARLSACLRAMPGLKVYPSSVNFLLLEVPGHANAAVTALRRHGVLVRDCSAIPGLTPATIRVAVRSSAENDRLVEVLQAFVARENQHANAVSSGR
jgi:threonine-phosphate decarboxylase